MESLNIFYGGGGFGGINKPKPPNTIVPCKTLYIPIASTTKSECKTESTEPERVYKKPVRRRPHKKSTHKKPKTNTHHRKEKVKASKTSHKKRSKSRKSKKQVKFANF